MTALPVHAQSPLDAARALLERWHEDPARIDRAREMLETAERDAPAPDALVDLARAWHLTGDFRAPSDDAKLRAYEHGRDAAQRAIVLAPRSDLAHLWYAINLARWAETTGLMRALVNLSTIRDELDTVLRLNPRNTSGLVAAGAVAAALPGLLGGDKTKAESQFGTALEVDAHLTGGRLELARLYIATKRWSDARRELRRIVDETAPTDRPRWTVYEAPEARRLLESIRDR